MEIVPLKVDAREHVYNILNDIPLFGGFNKEMTGHIIDSLVVGKIKRGEYIFKSGDSPKDIYIILSGSVACYFNDKLVHEFNSGLSLAEASVIGIQKFKSDAIAKEDCQLLILSKKRLFDLFNTDKEAFSMLILNIARELARRIGDMGDALRHCDDLEQKCDLKLDEN